MLILEIFLIAIVILMFAAILVKISIREAVKSAKPNVTLNINQIEKNEVSSDQLLEEAMRTYRALELMSQPLQLPTRNKTRRRDPNKNRKNRS